MKLADIEEKAQHYFEWPDGVTRNSVTLTSATLFARACVNEAVADHEEEVKRVQNEALRNYAGWNRAVTDLREEVIRLKEEIAQLKCLTDPEICKLCLDDRDNEVKRAVAAERERVTALEVYRTVAVVEFYVHKWGREGRLPVIDYLPESLTGEEVEVIIRQSGSQ